MYDLGKALNNLDKKDMYADFHGVIDGRLSDHSHHSDNDLLTPRIEMYDSYMLQKNKQEQKINTAITKILEEGQSTMLSLEEMEKLKAEVKKSQTAQQMNDIFFNIDKIQDLMVGRGSKNSKNTSKSSENDYLITGFGKSSFQHVFRHNLCKKGQRKNSADRARLMIEERDKQIGEYLAKKNIEKMELYDDFIEYEDPMNSLKQFCVLIEQRNQPEQKSKTIYQKGIAPGI